MSNQRGKYRLGDIILVPFPFTDLNERKVRPGIILSNKIRLNTIIVALVTSKKVKVKEDTDIHIDKTVKEFKKTGLKVSSTVRLSQIATVHTRLVIGKIGDCNNEIKKEIKSSLKVVFE